MMTTRPGPHDEPQNEPQDCAGYRRCWPAHPAGLAAAHDASGPSPRSVDDPERGINRTARQDTAELLAGALGAEDDLGGDQGGLDERDLGRVAAFGGTADHEETHIPI